MLQIKVLATALVFWHSSVLTVGRQGAIGHYQLPTYDPPKETCIGDAPYKNLSEVSQGEYSQHKAAVALLDCDERAVRVFTDANFDSIQDVEYFPDDPIIKRRQGQASGRTKSRPRSVGSIYIVEESKQKLQYWAKTHPNRAREIRRYIHLCIHLFVNITV